MDNDKMDGLPMDIEQAERDKMCAGVDCIRGHLLQ